MDGHGSGTPSIPVHFPWVDTGFSSGQISQQYRDDAYIAQVLPAKMIYNKSRIAVISCRNVSIHYS